MIESKVKQERLTQLITHWTEHTKVKPYLRDYDIPGLVHTILEEFYKVGLCCGHMVHGLDEGVHLEIKEYDGVVHGSYCKDCAEEYIEKGIATEAKNHPPLRG